MVHGEEAFTRGLVLERLPNTEYARESDWVWMTGLFSTNRAEGIKMLDTELRFLYVVIPCRVRLLNLTFVSAALT
jgi:hypothetical protein